MSDLILAGDLGGTKVWLGLYAPDAGRPTPVDTRRYRTTDFDGVASVLRRFLDETGAHGRIIDACLGVAGPVAGNACDLTNVPWRVDGTQVGQALGIESALVLNDLAAMACSLPHLRDDEAELLQPGVPAAGGALAVIAPGTHLGEASLCPVGDGFVPVASEGGHAEFAARTPWELELVASLLTEMDRVGRGDILSGPGIVRLHRFSHRGAGCAVVAADARPDAATVTAAALGDACPRCRDAIDLFVAALGSACADLALSTLATGGLFIGGGIAPQIVPALRSPAFLAAFRNKGAMRKLVERVPVSVILEPQAALVGAAVAAGRNLA